MTTIQPGMTVSIPMETNRGRTIPNRRIGKVLSVKPGTVCVQVPRYRPRWVAMRDCVVVDDVRWAIERHKDEIAEIE